jgi:hypothetical protein
MVGWGYRLSFTTGGLLLAESVRVAGEYARLLDWPATVQLARRQNLLQTRTASSGDRMLHEVCSRLRRLTPVQLALLLSGSNTDQQQLLWLAACKRYEVLRDFGSEVIRGKFWQLDRVVFADDFDEFLEAKAIWHPEIEKLADTTRAKLRQVALRMLREADILSSELVIQPTIFSPAVARAIHTDSVAYFDIFPVSEDVLRRALA